MSPSTPPVEGAFELGQVSAAAGAAEAISSVEIPDELMARVIRVVSETQKLPEGRVTAASTFEELGIDSLDGINIIFGLETEFNVNIDDEQARKVRDISGLADGIARLVAVKA